MLEVSHCVVYLTFIVMHVYYVVCRQHIYVTQQSHISLSILFFVHSLSMPCLLLSLLPFFLQTALCSTAIDNPNSLTKFDLVQHIISYLDTDTVLFQSSVSNRHI
jgi:hypothetical protein